MKNVFVYIYIYIYLCCVKIGSLRPHLHSIGYLIQFVSHISYTIQEPLKLNNGEELPINIVRLLFKGGLRAKLDCLSFFRAGAPARRACDSFDLSLSQRTMMQEFLHVYIIVYSYIYIYNYTYKWPLACDPKQWKI